jgi:hypothetical protein
MDMPSSLRISAGFSVPSMSSREVLLDERLGLGDQRLGVAVLLGGGKLGCLLTGHLAEDHDLGQGVGTQTVGAVQTDGGTFASGVETGQTSGALAVSFDATHGVVGSRTYRNRLFYRIHTHVGLGQFADEGQTLFQVLLAKVAQVEVNHVAHGALDHAAFLLLLPEGLGETVARTQLHVLVLRLADRGFRAQTVILQVAIAILVEQDATLTTTTFGHQDAGARQTGRVILDELHVPQRYAVAVGQGHAVTGDDAAVGVVAIDTTGAAGGQHHGLGLDEAGDAVLDVKGDDTWTRPSSTMRSRQKCSSKRLMVGYLMEVWNRVCRMWKPDLSAANQVRGSSSRRNGARWPCRPVCGSGATPVLQLDHLVGGVVDEVLDYVLLTQPVTTGDGVVEVVFQGVVITDDACGAAFGGHRVAAHRIDLGDQGDLQLRVGFCNGDCGTQATATGTDDGNIGLDNIHICLLRDRFAGHDFAL